MKKSKTLSCVPKKKQKKEFDLCNDDIFENESVDYETTGV